MTLQEYLDEAGRSPFGRWFDGINAAAAAKVTTARIEQRNFSNVEGVGSGVFERKIDFGPGYRVYFGKDGERLIILVGGGTKKGQAGDIARTRERWAEYKQRKGKG
ncbi:MAG: type II toxin-antitoxin system RelE/ParE family toxin [Acidobacteriota bacterium]